MPVEGQLVGLDTLRRIPSFQVESAIIMWWEMGELGEWWEGERGGKVTAAQQGFKYPARSPTSASCLALYGLIPPRIMVT